MLTDTHVTQGEPLLSYKIASSNMRYIEINEREIYLRQDPQLGIVLLGEVPFCGPDCNANLSQMLLEYTMSTQIDCMQVRRRFDLWQRPAKIDTK